MAPLVFVNIMDAYFTLLYIEFVSKVCSLYNVYKGYDNCRDKNTRDHAII